MGVRGSTPRGTTSGGLAQLARAPALQAGGQGFDSLVLHKADNQMVISLFFVLRVSLFGKIPLREISHKGGM
mgnify:CR=1 FL=1